jgi:2-polyprenyl-6-methoxyphenol hydroxylase-like FAD-dependent oxidoreductase
VTYDVVVVGAGVGGLAAAIGAGRDAGARTLVIDRRRDGAGVDRGELLQPAALEILDRWGVEAELRRQGAIRIEALECRDARGRPLGSFEYGALAHRFDHGLVHAHAHIRGALLAEAARAAEVRFDARAAGLVRDGRGRTAGVVVESGGRDHRVGARLVVAADGPSSGLRRRLAIPVRRTAYGHQFAAFDLAAPGLPPRVVAFLTRQGARIVCPMPGGRARLYAQVPAGDRRVRDGADWRRMLAGGCPGLRDLLDLAERDLARPRRFAAWRATAETWTRAGVVLVGDAAHCVHPMAGQGMAAAIGDGWTLGQAMGALGPDAGAQRYQRLRMPRVRELAHASDLLARLCTVRSPLGLWLVRGLLLRNRGNRALRLAATRRLAGLERGRLPRREWLRAVTGR